MQRWGVLEEIWRDASHDYENFRKASMMNYKVYKRLGIIVVIITSVIGTAVFNSIVDNQQNIYIKYATGFLSVAAAVLSAVQAFADYGAMSRKQYEFSVECYAIIKSIDIFYSTYPSRPTKPAQRAACDTMQNAIVERYTKAKPGVWGETAAA